MLQPQAKPRSPATRAIGWKQDPDGVRRNILDVARQAFVEHGLSGARVDDIAARTSTSKRMIYYYFTDKEGLYLAVLEEAYGRIRSFEQSLDLDAVAPDEALRRLTAFTFDYHADNPDFVRLVMVENIHHGRHLEKSEKFSRLNLSAIDILRKIYERGVSTGIFRRDLAPIDIHLTISALSFYNVSNRDSIRHIFGHDMAAHANRRARRDSVVDAVLRFVRI
ncbi:MAG: TetR/AcrR family transcriptional regulator [Beijerinckiaceae bacterium]